MNQFMNNFFVDECKYSRRFGIERTYCSTYYSEIAAIRTGKHTGKMGYL